MKRQSLNQFRFCIRKWRIEGIGEDGSAIFAEMDAHLVGTSCEELAFDESVVAVEAPEDAVVGVGASCAVFQL